MCYLCCSVPIASTGSPHMEMLMLLLPHLPEHCCWMSFICSRTIFIPSFLCLKISPGFYGKVPNLPSGTGSCLNLSRFHLCILISHYFQIETSVLLLTLCFSLKCPLPCFFLDLSSTDLSRKSSNPMSFHEACHSHSGPHCCCLLWPSAYVNTFWSWIKYCSELFSSCCNWCHSSVNRPFLSPIYLQNKIQIFKILDHS